MVTFEEFKKMELKVADIVEVQDLPDADRLYVITIDLGDTRKQIVAGIKNFYSKESLLGRQVVVINNLEPAVVRGVESQAMLLAAQDETGICIVSPERRAKAGSIVK